MDNRNKAQILMSIGVVLLLISALWMGVLAPSMKKLPTDFESELVFEGDMTLLNADRLLSVSGTLDKNTAIDMYPDPSTDDGDGPTIVISIKGDPKHVQMMKCITLLKWKHIQILQEKK